MTENSHRGSDAGLHAPEVEAKASSESAEFIRGAVGFGLIGLALYAALYAVSEDLIDRHLVHADLFLAGPNQLLDRNCLMVEITFCEFV